MTTWEDIRKIVLERDGYQCKVCGEKPSAQVHHIVSKREGGGNETSNLITLCGRCHMLVSPVPDWVLSKVWKIPPDKIKSEESRIKMKIESIRNHNLD